MPSRAETLKSDSNAAPLEGAMLPPLREQAETGTNMIFMIVPSRAETLKSDSTTAPLERVACSSSEHEVTTPGL